MTDSKQNTKGKTNKPLAILVVILSIVVGAMIFGFIWLIASPFDTPDIRDFPQIDGKPRGTEISQDETSTTDQSKVNELGISVDMKDGSPQAKFKLPFSGAWGLPRFYFEQDKQTKGWSLVFIPPAGKGDYDRQIQGLASAWRRVLPGGSETTSGTQDPAYGTRHQVSIPSGKVRLKTGIALSTSDFDKRREELKSSAKILSDLANDEAAKNDFLKALENEIPGAMIVFSNISKDIGVNENTLTTLAGEGHLYICSKLIGGDKNTLLDKFYFDASPLRWVGSIGFSRAKRRSPMVEVHASNGASEYVFESAYHVNSDNPGKELSLISRFQEKTAENFVNEANKTNTTWPGELWLLANDPVSLNPMSFIGVLQSLQANYTMGDTDKKEVPKLIEELATGITKERVSQMQAKLDRISKLSNVGYRNTYIYCEYVVALVHLQKLVHKIPGDNRGQYDRKALQDLILDASGRVADNVMPDGRFKRSMDGSEQGWDRSVGQVALYTLQYVQLHFSGERANDKIAKVNEALKRLANGHGKYRTGVPYNDDNPTPHSPLEPAHFQASIAKLQLKLAHAGELIEKEEFQKDLDRIDAIFTSTLTLDPDPVKQAYQLMYWARVYELLASLRQETSLAEYFDKHEGAINKMRASLLTWLSLNKLHDILKTRNYWSPDNQLVLKSGGDPPPEVRDVMLVIALESLRTAYTLLPSSVGN